MKGLNQKKYINIFLIYFVMNISFTLENYNSYIMKLKYPISELFINNGNDKNDPCKKWIPSLFSPMLLLNTNITINTSAFTYFEIKIPVIHKDKFNVGLHNYSWGNYSITLSKERFSQNLKNCYFGLLHKIGDFNIDENLILLNQLNQINAIEKRIFSFDKWSIKKDIIETAFYYGDAHENFKSKNKKGIFGSCKSDIVDKYWGCKFNKMSFNNTSIELINDNNNKSYFIYFSSENYNIIFPKDFEYKFNFITHNICDYSANEDGSNFTCNDFFNDDGFANIELIDDNMSITIEIDNLYRFNNSNSEGINKTRIIYEDIEYFIFPLIMFKNFHIQFNAENNLISFYTTNKEILHLFTEEDSKKKGSSGLTIFLVILIILAILGFGYGAFWLLKKRRGSIEKNINKYNKFEDEENFQNLNENRVF